MTKAAMNRSLRSSRSSTIGRVRGRGEISKASINQRTKGRVSNSRGPPTKKSTKIQQTNKTKTNQQSNRSSGNKKTMPSLEAAIKNKDICTKIEPEITAAEGKNLVAGKGKSVIKNVTAVVKTVTRSGSNSDKTVLNAVEEIDQKKVDAKEVVTSGEENVNVSIKATRTSNRVQAKNPTLISNVKSPLKVEKSPKKSVGFLIASEIKNKNEVISTIPKAISSPTVAATIPNTISRVNYSETASISTSSINMPISSINCGISSIASNTKISSGASVVSAQTMITSQPLISPPPPMIKNNGTALIGSSGPQQQWVPVYVVDMPNLQKSESGILRPMAPPPSMISSFPTSPVKPSLPLTSTVSSMGLPRMVTKPVPIAARLQKPLMKTKAIPIPSSLFTSVPSMPNPSTMPVLKPLSTNTTTTAVLNSVVISDSSNTFVGINFDDRMNNKRERKNSNPMKATMKPEIGNSGSRNLVMMSPINPNVEKTSVNEDEETSSSIDSPEKNNIGPASEVKCVLCEKVFPSLKDMQEHYLKTHKGRKSREKNKRNMENSATQTAVETSRNTNKECNESSGVPANGSQPHPLQIIIDDAELDPKCPVCSCGFKTVAEVKRHVAEVHSYICSECNITFYTLFQFTSHKCTKVTKKGKKNKKMQNNNTITSSNINKSIVTSETNKTESSLHNSMTKFVAIKPKLFVQAPPCDDLSEPPVLTAEPSMLLPLPQGNHMSSPPPLQKISNISDGTRDNPYIIPSQSEVTPSSKINTNSVTPQKPKKVAVIETNNIEEAKKLAKRLDMESPDEKLFKPEVVLQKLDQLKSIGHLSISFVPKKKRPLDEVLEGEEHLEYVCGRCNVLCFDMADYMDHIQECLIMSSVSVVPSRGPRRFLKLKKEVASFAFDDQNNNNYTLNKNLINKLSEVLGPSMSKPMIGTPSVSPDKSTEKKLPPTPNQKETPTTYFHGLAPPPPQLYGAIPVPVMQNTVNIPYSTNIPYPANIPYTFVTKNIVNAPTQFIHPPIGNVSVASTISNVSVASSFNNISVASTKSNVSLATANNKQITVPGGSNMISKTFTPFTSSILSNNLTKTTSTVIDRPPPKKEVPKKTFSGVIVPKFIPRSQVGKNIKGSATSAINVKSVSSLNTKGCTTPAINMKPVSSFNTKGSTTPAINVKPVSSLNTMGSTTPTINVKPVSSLNTKGSTTPSINVKPVSSLMNNPTMVNSSRISTSIASPILMRESGKSVNKVHTRSPAGSFPTLKSFPTSTVTTNVPTNSIVTSMPSGVISVKTTQFSKSMSNDISSYIFTPQISKNSSTASSVSSKTTTAPSTVTFVGSSDISRQTHPSFRDLLDDDDFPLSSQQPQKTKRQTSRVMEKPHEQQKTHNLKVPTNNSVVGSKSPNKKGIKLNQAMVMIPLDKNLTKGTVSGMMTESRDIMGAAESSTLDLLLDADDIKMEVEEEVLNDIF
ncbi:unnamed protein product [Meganyctiphanes norvegica]|uniref:C2H2-type domain-containing protein n=1 Tax=Meganyctiphanes norvegica TaxID=48144 RepID=A0AAV2QAV2_MEGNR